MLRFNPDRIEKIVSSMRVALYRLYDLAQLNIDVFLEDPHKISSAKYNFMMAIEAVIDIANHVISKNGFRAPEDYADTFSVLGEHGLIDKNFVEKLRKMARFRNRLVHIYWDVDDEQVFEIIKNDLGDFKIFLNYISSALGLDQFGINGN